MSAGVSSVPGSRPRCFDRSFEAAVREGCLSVAEAVRRGNRQAYAEHLRLRFRLTEEMALRVTDNRVLLADMLRATGRIRGHPRPQRGFSRPARLQAITLMIGLLALGGLFSVHNWQRQLEMGRRLESLQIAAPRVMVPQAHPHRATTPETPRALIERDDRGRITKISAGHPADVVAALCTGTAGSCDTMEIRQSEPPFPGRRVGRFTIAHSTGKSATLPIRRDRRSGRWVAGTGLAPIASTHDAGGGESAGPDEDGSGVRCGLRDGSDCVTAPRPGAQGE